MTDMKFRRLGTSGLVVSAVGLGTNNFGMKISPDEAKAVTDAAIDAGITLFDTADVYGASEAVLGELLEGRREDVIIATKWGSPMTKRGADSNGEDWNARGARRYIRRAVEGSLRRLRTDYIDLYQMHRPDPLTPIEETLSALDDLVTEGKVRYLGHSNFSGFQTAHAEWTARTRGTERFISAQNEYSLLKRTKVEDDLTPSLVEYGIGLLPFFPLASGLLTGKYRRGEAPPQGSRIQAWKREAALTDAAFDVIEKLESFAAERSVTLLDVAMGGLAAQPSVSSVIAGATTPEQVRANAAAGLWSPTAEDLATIDEITKG
ncbi:MAG: aldo/keto reductase [Pseudonocardiales bacterium]|nr:aldo/keto reductase [Jatrophihabitantaceae bacterium]MCW2602620.1 aldo/keto reductase [Pseudonocardiales bacterium]